MYYMKEIVLENSTLKALIDFDDFERVSKLKWTLSSAGYVVINPVQKGVPSFLHRIVLNSPSTECVVDHINGNKLDNRKNNLRVCSRSANLRNSKLHSVFNKTSKYKGVSKDRRERKWCATISIGGSGVRLITTCKEVEAGYAYDCATSFLGVLAYKNNCDKDLSEERKFHITTQVINRILKNKPNWKQLL